MPKVLMVQYFPHKWQIVSAKNGNVILSDININTIFHAHEYIKAWISSFHCWDYEVVPLPKVKK